MKAVLNKVSADILKDALTDLYDDQKFVVGKEGNGFVGYRNNMLFHVGISFDKEQVNFINRELDVEAMIALTTFYFEYGLYPKFVYNPTTKDTTMKLYLFMK